MFTVSILVLLVVTVVGILLAPWIVDLYTLRVHGPNRAQQQELATELLRLFMPQMLFYGIATLATAMLNARRRFAAAAFAPALNNLVVIAVFLALPRVAERTASPSVDVLDDDALVLLMGLGTTAGIVVMALALLPALHRRARPPALPPRVPASGGRHPRARLRLDRRVRDRQPDRAVRRHRSSPTARRVVRSCT